MKKKIIFSALAILLCCVLLASGFTFIQKSARGEVVEYLDEQMNVDEQENDVHICVYGKSKLSITPDCAVISASIEVVNNEMLKAKEENFKIFDEAIKGLKELGATDDDITLNNYYSYPNYDYSVGKKIIGYLSSTSFNVKVNSLDKIKSYIDVLSEKGVTNICDINYKVSDIDEQYSTLLSSAVENAKSKAMKLLGKEEVKIVSIKEEAVYSNNSLWRTYTDSESANAMIGKVELEARVLVEFN